MCSLSFLVFHLLLTFSLCATDESPSALSEDGVTPRTTKTVFYHEVIGINVLPKQQQRERIGMPTDNVVHMRLKFNETLKMVVFATSSFDVPYLAWGWYLKQRLQVFKSIMLGEAELKEPAYDSMCFIDVLQEKEIVDFPSLKIIKQLSKEPQVPEIDLGQEHISLDVMFSKKDFRRFGSEIEDMCSGAQHIYTTSNTIKYLAGGSEEMKTSLLSSMEIHATKNESTYPLCEEAVSNWDLGCLCRRPLCIPWYPCGLKYCPVANEEKDSKYVCGLLTCQKCKIFEFYVARKYLCFWNIRND